MRLDWMEPRSILPLHGVLPLVLHKVVRGTLKDWEDIHENVFLKILDCIEGRAVVPGENLKNEKLMWMLTFDDGNQSDYEIVYPHLIEKRLKATFFLITNKVGAPGYINWTQVREMHSNGMHIGSHSCSHHRMGTLSLKDASRELNDSKKSIEDFLGSEVSSFSYPYGECSKVLNELCYDAGYKFIFNSRHGKVKQRSEVFPRNSINSEMCWVEVNDVLNPSHTRLLKWFFEDSLKYGIKSLLGPDIYILFRDRIIKKK